MSHNIFVTFENRDAAELAASRLRRKGLAFRYAVKDAGSAVSGFAASPASVSLLYPCQPVNFSRNHTNTSNYETFARSIISAETMGLPLYRGAEETQVRFTVDDESYDDARAILRNCGGYNIK